MKKKATIILFPPDKSLEIDFLNSLTETQKFQFYQIAEIMLADFLIDGEPLIKRMLQHTIKTQQKKILALRKENEELKNLLNEKR